MSYPGTKSPSGTARSGQAKEALATERTTYGHDGHGSGNDQSVKKSQKAVSVAMNRWLGEPLEQGPFVVIEDVVGWGIGHADGKGGKTRPSHKGKHKGI